MAADYVGGPLPDSVQQIPGGGGGGGDTYQTDTGFNKFGPPDGGNTVIISGNEPNNPPFPGWRYLGMETRTDRHNGGGHYDIPASGMSGRIYIAQDIDIPYDIAAIDLTTFLGLRAGSYVGDAGPMTGFPAGNMPALLDGGFFGRSGTFYPSSGPPTLVLASELSAAYPQFDMSQWSGASGFAQVFTTTMPLSEFASPPVPEPATVALLFTCGGLFFRQRSTKRIRMNPKEKTVRTNTV
jgi:hypothetical protein